jgi:hypothetical protein
LGHLNYTDDDGTFRIVSVPGPVVLTGGLAYGRLLGGLAELMKYKPPLPDPKYPQYFRKGRDFQEYVGLGGKSYIVQGCFCKVLQIEPGATLVKQDIILERASALAVKIQDAEGRPLAGTWVAGISPERYRPALWIDKDSCSAYHVEADEPRLMVFFEPGKKLAGTRMLKGDEKQPVVVKLGPAGAIKGRLLDADVKPLAGVVVELVYQDRQAAEVHQAVHKDKQVVTDAAGAFTFDDLIPERKFFVCVVRRGEALFEEGLSPRDAIVRAVKPGECRDLGAIKLRPTGN